MKKFKTRTYEKDLELHRKLNATFADKPYALCPNCLCPSKDEAAYKLHKEMCDRNSLVGQIPKRYVIGWSF